MSFQQVKKTYYRVKKLIFRYLLSHLDCHHKDIIFRCSKFSAMPTLDDFNNLGRERRDMRRKVITVPLKMLFTYAFGFYAFRFLQIDDPVDRKLYLLFVPIGFLIALMLKNSLDLQWYRKVIKYLIPIALILYGIYMSKRYIEHAYYYKLGARDFFVLSLVFTNLFLIFFHREAASKGLPRFLLRCDQRCMGAFMQKMRWILPALS